MTDPTPEQVLAELRKRDRGNAASRDPLCGLAADLIDQQIAARALADERLHDALGKIERLARRNADLESAEQLRRQEIRELYNEIARLNGQTFEVDAEGGE